MPKQIPLLESLFVINGDFVMINALLKDLTCQLLNIEKMKLEIKFLYKLDAINHIIYHVTYP